MTTTRLTDLARGGGCACKVPAEQLERLLAAVGRQPGNGTIAETGGTLLVGTDTGDDAAVATVRDGTAIISTADFFTPVVDDPYDWGRIAAANALSDVYAMGGQPLLAINLVAWPRDDLSEESMAAVLAGGADVCALAGCFLAGGHTVDAAEPLYGLAVTGTADPERLLRNDAGEVGLPLTLTKPLGVGILNNRHKVTGEKFPEAVESMVALNADASRAAVAAGVRCATDVTGFGLLGHLMKLARASGVTAVVDSAAVPVFEAARRSVSEGFVPGGSKRNLDWVRPHTAFGPDVDEDTALLLADAQTSGGLLVAGELPGHPVIGRLEPKSDVLIRVV